MTEQEAPPMMSAPELDPHPESLDRSSPPAAAPSALEIAGIIADPWLRFFARIVDLQIWLLILGFATGLVLPSLFDDGAFLTGQLGSRLFTWVLTPVALLLDALSYRFLGNTPAKWLAGIKVKSLAGDKVSFSTYLKRNLGVYWFGLGTGFPVVTLVTMGINYRPAEEREPARWDESTGTRAFVKAHSNPRLVLVGAIWLLIFIWETVQSFP